jgi:hypothetical protein
MLLVAAGASAALAILRLTAMDSPPFASMSATTRSRALSRPRVDKKKKDQLAALQSGWYPDYGPNDAIAQPKRFVK